LVSENIANRLRIGNQSVACKSQAFDRPLCRFFIASAASIGNQHRDVTEIGSMARCWFDSDLSRYAGNDKGVNTAISQSEIEPCAFEGGHRKFVEYPFTLTRR
jgi:hypothetical protein